MRPSGDKLPMVADRQRPDLAVVPLELLDELKLVAVPVLEHLVLADGPEVVRQLRILTLTRVVAFECNLHDALVVSEDGFVAITEIEAPDLHVLVRRAGDNELRVVGDVHGQDRKLRGN